ncbi:hypothetical protein FI667_g7214, partial [Globisporangium splendens]
MYSTVMSDSVLLFAPGWHRKWVLLLIVLIAGFVNRYRLMGLLLSKAIAFHLAKQQRKHKEIDVSVQVKLVLLRLIQFVHVEMKSGSGDWTLLFTKITLHCYIKEFFHSFGQTKMFALEIGDVVGELYRLDETLLHELVRQKPRSHAANPEPANANPAATNPVGFLQFVDFQVGSIRLKLRCFEVATEFRCRALFVGITDVLVAQNLLYVEVQASPMYLRTYREAKKDSQDMEDVIRDEIRFNCPNLCLIAELQLMNQKIVGFKLVGNKEDLVSIQLCTPFLEFLMLKKLELIQKGLFQRSEASALAAKPQDAEAAAVGSSNRIVAKDISDLHFSVIVVHELQDQIIVPVQFAAEIGHLSTTKVAILPSELQENLELEFVHEMIDVREPSGVQLSLKKSSQLEWEVTVKTRSWTVKVVDQTKSTLAEELVVVGLSTVMTTKIAPSDSPESKQHEFQVEEIRANVAAPCAKEKQAHCIFFVGAELALTKSIVQHPQYTKITGVEAKFRSVAVNDLKDGSVDAISQFPIAYMKDVLVKRQDKRREVSMDTEISMPSSSVLTGENAQSQPQHASEVLKNIEIMLYDVYDVAQLVAVRIKDVSAIHQKMKLAIHSSFDCAQFSLLWGDSLPAIELSGASFAQKVLFGHQLLLAKTPVQTTVKATHMAVFARPGFDFCCYCFTSMNYSIPRNKLMTMSLPNEKFLGKVYR